MADPMFSKIRLGTQIIGLACLMGGATALLVGYAVVKMQSVSSNLEHTGQVVMPLAASLAQLDDFEQEMRVLVYQASVEAMSGA